MTQPHCRQESNQFPESIIGRISTTKATQVVHNKNFQICWQNTRIFSYKRRESYIASSQEPVRSQAPPYEWALTCIRSQT